MEYKPSFQEQLDVDYICHHGIKGMHWGVRRYQNPDGSLTAEGRQRYYNSEGRLTAEGQEFNRKATINFRSYKDATLYNTRAVNPNFSKAEKRYKQLQAKSKEAFKKDYDNWASGKDYKNLDYEDFKDAAYSRYLKTAEGKERKQLVSDMRKMLDETAKEHPLYNKNYRRLREFNSDVYAEHRNLPVNEVRNDFETLNFGKSVVNTLMGDLGYYD